MATLTLQPDAGAGKDASINAGAYADRNYGVSARMTIGDSTTAGYLYRGLIQFDLSPLPAAAVISSATLSLWANLDRSANARTLRVYRLKRAWVEGTRDDVVDSPATGCTWTRYDTANNWQTAGGFGANDCEQTEIGSRAFTATEALNEFKHITLTPTSKAALDLGYGWLLKMDTEDNDAYGFDASDSATAAQRPKLTIEYTLPPSGGGGIFGSSIFHSAIMGGTITR